MRTDMAMEMRNLLGDMEGVDEQTEWENGIGISRICVHTEEAARKLDKPQGSYVTLRLPEGAISDADYAEHASARIASELKRLLPASERASALVIGLGNRYVTPDALGPRVSEHVYVTRHILKFLPDMVPADTRSVAACAPNVLGVTGMETVEVVTGLVREVKPQFVIAVDCLCSSDSQNIGASVQMNDSGISPGAGIGNFQQQLNEQTLGVPVIAVGIPLVISRETIVMEAFDALSIKRPLDTDGVFENDLIVTPKDIDAIVRDASRMLSEGLNTALFGERRLELGKLLQ